MSNLSIIICGGYLIAALFCIIFGIYFLYMNTRLNKVIFLACSSLSCWCFGTALFLRTIRYEESMLWLRFSMIGMSTLYVFLLRYVTVLMEQKRFLKRNWLNYALYIPAVIAVFGLALCNPSSGLLYTLQSTSIGLNFVFTNPFIQILFDFYQLSYVLIGLWLVLKWKKDSKQTVKKEHVRFLIVVYTISVCFFVVDIVFRILSIPYYFYEIIPFVLIILLFLNWIRTRDIWKYLSIEKSEWRVIISSILLSLLVPIVTLQLEQNAGITIWAFSFIIIIVTLLFNHAIAIILVSTSVLLTQCYLWIFISEQAVSLKTSDYLLRLGLLGLGVVLIYYINRIYLLRLSQLSEKVKAQDLLFLVSSHVIQVNNENVKEKMNEVLALIGKYVQADRVHISFQNIELIEDSEDYYCWCNEAGKMDNGILHDVNIVRFSWMKEQLKENAAAFISDTNELPPEAEKEKIFLSNQQVKSMMVIPLVNGENKIGFLRIDYVTNTKKFDDAFTKILITLGNILGEAHIKTSSEKKMEKMAYFDQLTNIPNRQMFSKCINRVIEDSALRGELFGIIFLDLDSFKIVNDTLGHHYGDKILIMIANRLERCIRKTDTVCRFGGDEFLIMLNDVQSKKDIETVAEKIIEQLEKPLFIEEQEFNITASVGISMFPIDGVDNDTLIKNADIAMYKAKSSGRNQVVFVSTEMKQEIEQSLMLTNNLYHALERSELDIVYQPQVEIETGEIIAIEALARWYHPELGIISPGIFIPIAEHTSLINSIGEWILRKACSQNKEWQNQGLKPVRVAVNVSVNQLLNPNFVNRVINILEDTGLETKYLELEITENVAIQESEYIIGVLEKLKNLGISIAIDDFGIEYSSLNRIKLLPIDRLKIDMHFIKGILTCDKDKVIVDVIIKLAKDLHLKVIAEGVETKEQLDYLTEKECDEVQGYYFYKPLSKEETEKALIKLTNDFVEKS